MNPFKKSFPNILENEPLSAHCTYNIGGPADFFYNLEKIDELPELIKIANTDKIKYLIIGRGTNILFPDEGYRGLIIRISAQNVNISGNIVEAEAGVQLSSLINISKDNSLSGLENLSGVPGTLGGGIYGNCGAFGTEISDFVEKIEIFNPGTEKIEEITKSDAQFSYRNSIFKKSKDVILKVTFKFYKEDKLNITSQIEEILIKRKKSLVHGFSCGSYFKNPNEELKAGYLIEQAGCKGQQVGYAKVSEKNANYLINLGNATQKDVLELADIVKEKVKHKFEINLEEEVQIVRPN